VVGAGLDAADGDRFKHAWEEAVLEPVQEAESAP